MQGCKERVTNNSICNNTTHTGKVCTEKSALSAAAPVRHKTCEQPTHNTYLEKTNKTGKIQLIQLGYGMSANYTKSTASFQQLLTSK